MTTTMGPVATMFGEDAKTDGPAPIEHIFAAMDNIYYILLANEPPEGEYLNWEPIGYLNGQSHLGAVEKISNTDRMRFVYALVLKVQGLRFHDPQQFKFQEAPKWVAF